MSEDKYIEKRFLYLIIISLILHVAVYLGYEAMVASEGLKKPKEQPIFVDLTDLPEIRPPEAADAGKARHQAERRQRVAKETAPRGERERDKPAPSAIPRRPNPPVPSAPPSVGRSFPTQVGKQPPPTQGDLPQKPSLPQSDGVFTKRRRQDLPEVAKLFPRAEQLASIEESYRKKYGNEIEEGSTKFLNTEDIQFGSFLKRFETAVYGVWTYPAEAIRLGLEGVTPVRITFNRAGKIVNIEILRSSGSKMLDEEVLRALRDIGPIGSLPRGYGRDTFYLIAFFEYGIFRGGSRSIH